MGERKVIRADINEKVVFGAKEDKVILDLLQRVVQERVREMGAEIDPVPLKGIAQGVFNEVFDIKKIEKIIDKYAKGFY